ncbi:MAG: hypothetical protein HQM14_12895 [SAR324 cluster bacterium]|nr:hypothetical protein [SAR324 cluster bacterium]
MINKRLFYFVFFFLTLFIAVSPEALPYSFDSSRSDDIYIRLGQRAFEFLEDEKSAAQETPLESLNDNDTLVLSFSDIFKVSQILLPFFGMPSLSFKNDDDQKPYPSGISQKERNTKTDGNRSRGC